MKRRLTIGIIGGGNMGAAIIGGIRGNFGVCVAEKDAKRRAWLKSVCKVAVTDVPALMKRSDIVLLAVKPQQFDEILEEIKGYLQPRHLVVSIAAGITTAYIEKRLGKGVRVVRTMPNLPAQVGLGMTAIAKGKRAGVADLRKVEAIFRCVGKTLVVAESRLDAITAVSGSGPAYVFNFVECFIGAARDAGFSREEAAALVKQTLLGSMALLMESADDAATLRQRVTSKGGTTEAALKVFADKKIKETFSQALKAAKKRAKELSK